MIGRFHLETKWRFIIFEIAWMDTKKKTRLILSIGHGLPCYGQVPIITLIRETLSHNGGTTEWATMICHLDGFKIRRRKTRMSARKKFITTMVICLLVDLAIAGIGAILTYTIRPEFFIMTVVYGFCSAAPLFGIIRVFKPELVSNYKG